MIEFYFIYNNKFFQVKSSKNSISVNEVKRYNLHNIILNKLKNYRGKKIKNFEYFKNYRDLQVIGYNKTFYNLCYHALNVK